MKFQCWQVGNRIVQIVQIKTQVSILLVLMSLVGCVHRASSSTQCYPTVAFDHQNRLSHLNDWSFQGHMHYRRYGHQEHDLPLIWTMHNATYRIILSLPMTWLKVKINGQDQSASITLPNDQIIKTDNLERWMQHHIHWSLPISWLGEWLKGKQLAFGEKQFKSHLLAMNHARPWMAKFSNYHCVKGIALPYHMIIKSSTISVDLNITHWQINAV